MEERTLHHQQDAEDFVRGCAFFGTGGGGSPRRGLEYLSGALKQKGSVTWIDVEEVPDDAPVISLFYMGSISPPDPDLPRRLKELGMERRVENELVKAYRELEAFTKVSPPYLAAAEMGGINTPAPIAAAMELGLKVVDGDYGCGRANPEMANSLVGAGGYPVYPVAFCDYAGSVTVVKEAPSIPMVERIGKLVSSASFGLVGSAGYLLSGRQMKEAIYRGTLTRALQLGRTIRRARETGADPVAAAVEFCGGWLLFKGRVVEKRWEDREGYMFGHYCLEGADQFAGRSFKVWYKNENHISWLDGKPYVTSPDSIIAVTLPDGEPITNTDIAEGQQLAVVGIAAGAPYRTPAGLAVMGPRHYGFDLEYRPIEQIMGNR